MATLRIIIPVRGGKAAIVNHQHHPRRVILRQVAGPKRQISFPIGPVEVQYDGLGLEYIEIDRPGMVSLLEPSTIKPRTISFDAVIAHPLVGGTQSVETLLAILTNMSREDFDLVFVYGVRTLPYKLRMTNLSFNSIRRDINGNITQAMASIQLRERPRYVVDPVTFAAVKYEPPNTPVATQKTTTTSPPRTTTGSGGGGSGGDIVNRNVVNPQRPYGGGVQP